MTEPAIEVSAIGYIADRAHIEQARKFAQSITTSKLNGWKLGVDDFAEGKSLQDLAQRSNTIAAGNTKGFTEPPQYLLLCAPTPERVRFNSPLVIMVPDFEQLCIAVRAMASRIDGEALWFFSVDQAEKDKLGALLRENTLESLRANVEMRVDPRLTVPGDGGLN
jgi:hypothetical protein